MTEFLKKGTNLDDGVHFVRSKYALAERRLRSIQSVFVDTALHVSSYLYRSLANSRVICNERLKKTCVRQNMYLVINSRQMYEAPLIHRILCITQTVRSMTNFARSSF